MKSSARPYQLPKFLWALIQIVSSTCFARAAPLSVQRHHYYLHYTNDILASASANIALLYFDSTGARFLHIMTSLSKRSPSEIELILKTGQFESLILSVEYDLLECKAAPYDLRQPLGKVELAKDVSALANAKGGYLLLGVATRRNPTHRGDEITGISPFVRELCDADQYKKILNEYVYPHIPDLEVEWHASTSDTAKGILSIYVPPGSCDKRPFLCSQVEISGVVTGKLFGYFERVGDTAEAMSAHELRDTLKDGMRYKDLDRRLGSIESLLTTEFTNKNKSDLQGSIGMERLIQRAADARVAAGLVEVPSFFLAAVPLEAVKFPDLFKSRQAPEVKLIDNPPKYRDQGFDIDVGQPSQLVRGELMRATANLRKGLELWKDGSLIFVGRADSNFLGWAFRDEADKLSINNYVLTEVIALFFRLAKEIYRFSVPAPKILRVYFQLIATDDRKFELTHHRISKQYPHGFRGLEAMVQGKTFCTDFDLTDGIPEVGAFALLKEIYNFFGHSDDQIPYVDRRSFPHRIDQNDYLQN